MPSTALTALLSYILLYKYFTLFLFIFLGSFLLPLPDNTLLFAIGAFSGQGYLNVIISILVAYISNVLADILGYFLTYRYGSRIFKLLHIKTENVKFTKAENWLRKYSSITVFFTRLAGPFGPSVNFLAGLIRMPFKNFMLADLGGNFIDIFGLILLGYFAGNYWTSFIKNIQDTGWLVFIIFILYLGFFRY